MSIDDREEREVIVEKRRSPLSVLGWIIAVLLILFLLYLLFNWLSANNGGSANPLPSTSLSPSISPNINTSTGQ